MTKYRDFTNSLLINICFISIYLREEICSEVLHFTQEHGSRGRVKPPSSQRFLAATIYLKKKKKKKR